MKRTGLVLLAAFIGLVMMQGACQQRGPGNDESVQAENRDHGWSEIRIEAAYTDGELSISTDPHDIGVIGPGDEFAWVLACHECPVGTQFQITDLQYVADLHQLTDKVIEMFNSPDSEFRVTREDIGLGEPDPDMGRAAKAFKFQEPGLQGWAPLEAPITAQSTRSAEDKEDELWKFSVEVRVPGYNDDLPCDPDENNPEGLQDPKRACWDPHKYNHPSY
jgi:hypothetical protein